MDRIYLKKTDVVMVDRHQRGEFNDVLLNNWFECQLINVDWSTDSGTMAVSVEYCPNGERWPKEDESGYSVRRDQNDRAYYEI